MIPKDLLYQQILAKENFYEISFNKMFIHGKFEL